MYRTRTARAGDTFDSLSRVEFGDSSGAEAIRRANPSLTEPLREGDAVAVPARTTGASRVPATAPTGVSVELNGEVFQHWTQIQITRAVDNFDTVEIAAPFDPDNAAHRRRFRPLSFAPLRVFVGGQPLMTGTAVGVVPSISTGGRVVQISGYSLPGVLGDCTAPPAAADEMEFTGMTLRDILNTASAWFGLRVKYSAEPGATFGDAVGLEASDAVLPLLQRLARQRGVILSSTAEGELLAHVPAQTQPVAKLAVGQPPIISVTPFFNPQEYYSSITGQQLVSTGSDGSQHTVNNARLAQTLRPFTFEIDDAFEGDAVQEVRAKAGRMFGGAVSYSVELSTWLRPDGQLWGAGDTVTLSAPDAMIYRETPFIVRAVSFRQDAGGETATLDLVLPNTFTSDIPERMPWDE